MTSITGNNNATNLRLNTNASYPRRTSSNTSFNEKLRAGLKSGIDLTGSALRHIAQPIPGSAVLSSSISETAKNLSTSSLGFNNASNIPESVNGDINSLQDDMHKRNQEMLAQQIRVSQETTSQNAKSNLIRAYYDTGKAIAQNLK